MFFAKYVPQNLRGLQKNNLNSHEPLYPPHYLVNELSRLELEHHEPKSPMSRAYLSPSSKCLILGCALYNYTLYTFRDAFAGRRLTKCDVLEFLHALDK